LLPAWVVPALKMTTGFLDVTFSAVLMNFVPSIMLSRYPTMTLVSSSSPRASSISISLMSALFPMLTSFASPRLRDAAQSSTAAHIAPDWDMSEIFPFLGICWAKEAFISW